jgi:hypothetical protein
MIVGMNDFDFFIGSWTVVNRRRRALFAGAAEWDTYPATTTCRSILGGSGNTDEMTFPTKGTHGMSLRLFDAGRKDWSIYWANGVSGAMDPPVVGTFAGDRGDFYGDDVYEGKPIRVHYIWTGTTSATPRWEQEFSADGGVTWESNWSMEFTRA